jgi:hypothetical protein
MFASVLFLTFLVVPVAFAVGALRGGRSARAQSLVPLKTASSHDKRRRGSARS